MTADESVRALSVLAPKEGDVIVVSVPDSISVEFAAHLKRAFGEAIAGTGAKVILVSEGIDVVQLSPEAGAVLRREISGR